MRTADYDFPLPAELIASRPADQRDKSRLLVLLRDGSLEHRSFSDIPSYFVPGDMLVINNSRVFPARLTGHKPDGSLMEILLVEETSTGTWAILSRGSYTGPLMISDRLKAYISAGRQAVFDAGHESRDLIREAGNMPLPPYIKRRPDEHDKERYQTVYAEKEGSIAAPTAGLHFTKDLLDSISARSVSVRSVTLHVGTGTFKPIRADLLGDHRMESEQFEFDASLPEEIMEARKRGNRVFAVGTTTTRALEGYMSGTCDISALNGKVRGKTDIFIHEGYNPRAVDCLITNFHLPRSTPLMLASVFAGRQRLLSVYEAAIAMGYRFFSYGDAMLVL